MWLVVEKFDPARPRMASELLISAPQTYHHAVPLL